MPNLDEIKARRERITAGEWRTEFGEAVKIRAKHGGYVAILGWLKGPYGSMGRISNNEGEANAHFIANAPTDIDWLIDVYETAVFELLRQADCVCRTNDGSFNSSAVTHQADILHALEKLGLFNITGFGSYRYVWGNLTPKGEEMMKRAREVQYDF